MPRRPLACSSHLRLIRLETVGSTNEQAKSYAAKGDFGPLWIRADTQLSGRGRRGRAWDSAAGNLFCTGLFPVSGSARHTALLSFAAALAVYDTLETYVDAGKLSLKWPNDVLIGGEKSSGILLESGVAAGQKWVAVGIGINLLSHPEVTEFPATHVLAHIPPEALDNPEPILTGPDAVLAILAAKFEHWRIVYAEQGFAPLRAAWLARAYNVPGPVTVKLPKEQFSGQALGLGENGELQVRLQDGTIRDVHAGDVYF